LVAVRVAAGLGLEVVVAALEAPETTEVEVPVTAPVAVVEPVAGVPVEVVVGAAEVEVVACLFAILWCLWALALAVAATAKRAARAWYFMRVRNDSAVGARCIEVVDEQGKE